LILAAYNAGEGTVEAFRDGKRLVLKRDHNPFGVRTGGVPPYKERVTTSREAIGSIRNFESNIFQKDHESRSEVQLVNRFH
jgi:hypothetical protein